MSSGFLKQDRPALIEIAACALLLATIGAVVFGSHIEHGGRYSDDWGQAAEFRFQADGNVGRMIERFHDRVGGRPLLGVSVAARQALWLNDLAAQHALAVALGAFASLLFFVLLRTFGIAPGLGRRRRRPQLCLPLGRCGPPLGHRWGDPTMRHLLLRWLPDCREGLLE